MLLTWILLVVVIVMIIKSNKVSHRADQADRRSIENSYRLRALEDAVEKQKATLTPVRPPVTEKEGSVRSEPSMPDALLLLQARMASVGTQDKAKPVVPIVPMVPIPTESALPPVLKVEGFPSWETDLPEAPTQPEPARPVINWEQFMGVKLFAWVGAVALFFGVGLFVKYSFDIGLISPPIRVAIGFLTGLALLLGGLKLTRERYAVTVQTLCSASVLIFYANIFASCSFYHLIPTAAAFVFMVVVTAMAFLLAVRLDAQAIAILGLLGGFLTPLLLSSGEDHPMGLFGYLGILDAGLIAVALRKRWNYMVLLAAIATFGMQFGWVARFFEVEKTGVAMGIFISFACLFLLMLIYADRKDQVENALSAAAILMPVASLVFAFYLLVRPYPALTVRPGLLFGFVISADGALLILAWLRTELRALHLGAGAAVFVLLAIWTINFLAADLLFWALGLYLLFAILHSVFPVVLERLRPGGTPVWWAHLFAPLALLLVLVPIFKFETVPLLVWPLILLVDVLAIGISIVTLSLEAIAAVLLLTVLATAGWVTRIPAALTGLPEMLFIIGGFAIFFLFAGMLAAKRIMAKLTQPVGAGARDGGVAPAMPWAMSSSVALSVIPAMSVLLPFLLLTMVVLRLPLTDPSPVFGLAVLLLLLIFGLVRFLKTDWLAAAGLFGVVLLEFTWHSHQFAVDHAVIALGWYVGFYAAFALFPFLFRKQMADRVIPWVVAALAAPAQFYLVYRAVEAAFPNNWMGLLPGAFAVPPMLSLVRLLRTLRPDAAKRNTLLALFGGIVLFFITLIFPIQFERQWITLGWALEGVALLWLLHRVPHEGLKLAGFGLLLAAFARLALNPAVMHYQLRGGPSIFNWYLYAYGIVTLCLFAGARLMAPPRDRIKETSVPPILQGLGTVLAFLLLNIEIADYFSPGPVVTFEFSGRFARDMTYSLGWAVFAFLVMFVGITRQVRAARYGGIGLLTITVLKLFLHDLWSLGGLYRIASFIGLAMVLIPVSFLYQRFLAPKPETKREPKGAE